MPTAYYISEEVLTAATLLEDSSVVIAGDQAGNLRVFSPKNKHKKLSEILKKNVYRAVHASEMAEDKRHRAGVAMIKSSKKSGEVFSVDSTGRVISWQVVNRKGTLEIAALNYIDLNAELCYFSLEDELQQLVAGCGSNLYQLGMAISPALPVTIRLTPNSTSPITSVFVTDLEIAMTGHANGDVRLFIEMHKDSVFKLPTFTSLPILLIFPGNYSKMDKVTRKITVMQCLASIHALDSSGKLHIFDIEEKIDKPEKVLDLFAEEPDRNQCRIIQAQYDLEKSFVYILYFSQAAKCLKFLKFE